MDAKHHVYRSAIHTFDMGAGDVFKTVVLPFTVESAIQVIAFLEDEHAEQAIPGLIALMLRETKKADAITESLIVLFQKVFPRLGNLALDVVASTVEINHSGNDLVRDDVILFLKRLCLDDLTELFVDSIELMSIDRLQAVFTRLGECFKRAKKEKPTPSKEHPASKK